jgi:hypothetical protein
MNFCGAQDRMNQQRKNRASGAESGKRLGAATGHLPALPVPEKYTPLILCKIHEFKRQGFPIELNAFSAADLKYERICRRFFRHHRLYSSTII